jgi:hypothetical protein
MKNALIITVAVGLLAGIAQAEMTYSSFMFGSALNASGAPITDGTYVMVLDLNGNGFNGSPSYLTQATSGNNASSWAWDGTNDMVMDRGPIVGGEAYPTRIIEPAEIPGTYNANVDHYYVLWFDTPYNPAAAGPGANVHYGVEDLGTVGTDPGTYTTYPDGGNATLVTTAVPEPVSASLLLVGGCFLSLRRRIMGKRA